MRKLLYLLSLTPLLLLSQGKKSKDLFEQGLKKYENQSGSISYTVSGDAEGEEQFVFDRYGWRSLKKRKMNFVLYGIETEQVQHEVSDGEILYRIVHKDSTIRKRVDIKWSLNAASMAPDQASEAILFSLGGTHASDSLLLGKTCQVWTFKDRSLQELWIWKGLVLKRKSLLGDQKIVTTATDVSLDVKVDESLFSLPSGYQIPE